MKMVLSRDGLKMGRYLFVHVVSCWTVAVGRGEESQLCDDTKGCELRTKEREVEKVVQRKQMRWEKMTTLGVEPEVH